MPSMMGLRCALVAAVLLRAAAAIKIAEELSQIASQGEAEGKAAEAEHKEAELKPLSRKERMIAERKARKKAPPPRPGDVVEQVVAERKAHKEAARKAAAAPESAREPKSGGEREAAAADAQAAAGVPSETAAAGDGRLEAEREGAPVDRRGRVGQPAQEDPGDLDEEDPEARRDMEGRVDTGSDAAAHDSDDMDVKRPHRRRRAPDATPTPTAEPTRFPTPFPTPEPTYTYERPGVPCECHKPSCFGRFDINNDTCITQDECDSQWMLLGNCSATEENPASYGDGTPYGPPVWDLDGDGCINYTEWGIVYDATNGSVCPQEPPEPCDECPEGFIIEPNPCDCVPCVGGEVRRRRSLECTPCPPPLVDMGDFDDCKDPSHPHPREAPNGSVVIIVDIPVHVCDEFRIGDTITLSAIDPDCVTTDDSCRISHTTIVLGVTPVTGGFRLDLADPLPRDFVLDTRVQQACNPNDGTSMSSRNSPTSDGCACECGGDTCYADQYEQCLLYPNGTGVCLPPGPYPEHPTPAPTVGARGDPHLVNLQGEHFDINHAGKFTLLRFPQAAEKPAEFSFQAGIEPDVGKPCTTYITEVEISGDWLGGKSLQIRCYRKSDSNATDRFLGARLLSASESFLGARPGESDSPWQTIEEFQASDLVLSDPESRFEVSLDKATWFPKKRSGQGPKAAGMFTLSLRNKKSRAAAQITMRQDLPEQEHLNVAMRRLSQLGRVDVGGLLGFDAHPASLERPSAACAHFRATARYRIESQDEVDQGYYFRPAWKERWDKIRSAGRSRDNEAAASLVSKVDDMDAHYLGSAMCKCSSDDSSHSSYEGVLVEEASFIFAEASWE